MRSSSAHVTSVDGSSHLRRLQMDGWTVVEGLIPASKVAAIRQGVLDTTEELADQAQRGSDVPGAVSYGRDASRSLRKRAEGVGHVPGFLNYNQSIGSFLADDRLMVIVRATLGPQVKISFSTGTTNYPGNGRGAWHADWPCNQQSAGCMPSPYLDAAIHLTTLWMLSPFTEQNGGTLIVPGSHRNRNNPSGTMGVDRMAPYPTEMNVTGEPGSVLIMDSRLWHATAPNRSAEPRIAVVFRYAPWWLNTRILMPGSFEHEELVARTGGTTPEQPALSSAAYARLPAAAQKLLAHWVEENAARAV